MKNFYYLIASLPELSLDQKKLSINIFEFLKLCEENLNRKEFNELKKIFIFNDIKNSIFYKDQNFTFYLPSFYSEEEFKENLKDPESFFPFIAEYFYYSKIDKRLYPKMLNIDELILLFYFYIEKNFVRGFLRKYFLFELNLRNAVTALYLRVNQISDPTKIILYSEESLNFIKNMSPDFGLSLYLDYINKLVDVFKDDDILKIEREIENIRWKWLEENGEEKEFSIEKIFSYAIKLLSLERWSKLTEEDGAKVFNKIIENITTRVKF